MIFKVSEFDRFSLFERILPLATESSKKLGFDSFLQLDNDLVILKRNNNIKPNKMNLLDKAEKLRKTRVAFWINLPICIISMIVLFKSIDSQILWKIIASSIGFLGFLSMTLLVFRQLLRLQKTD
jgi:hypothetical protein